MKKIVKNNFLVLFALVFLVSLFIYTRYFTNLTFGDEYDNFTYSWLFSQGLLPYRDFFTHHLPTLIFLGLPLELIGHSQTIYRIFVLFVTFSFFTFFTFYFKGIWRYINLVFMLFSSYAISFYGGFQFADGSFWAIFIVAGFLLVLKKDGDVLNSKEIFLFASLIVLSAFSSPMHIAAYLLLILLHIYLQYKNKGKILYKEGLKNLKTLSSFIFISILIFVFYLLLTSSTNDFYHNTVKFNNDVFYYRVYNQKINPKILDFYLNTSLDLINHLKTMINNEGLALLTFAKSAKFLLLPYLVTGNYFNYARIIFNDLYNTFFSFEMFIVLFYLLGLTGFLLMRKGCLVLFVILFIWTLRLRVPERIHEAPYYLLSYWLISVAAVVFINGIRKGSKIFINALLLVITFLILYLFVEKNRYDFGQIAFNRFPKHNLKTVEVLKSESNDQEKIIVIGSETANYFYDSKRLPYGKFVNYFWYFHNFEKLRGAWLSEIRNYPGNFLIVRQNTWDDYKLRKTQEDWLVESLDLVDKLYERVSYPTNDYIFRKK